MAAESKLLQKSSEVMLRLLDLIALAIVYLYDSRFKKKNLESNERFKYLSS